MLRFVITVSRRADSMRRFPSRCQGFAGGFLSATLATCARSLPVPLDAIRILQRDTPPTVLPTTSRSVPPLRGTPRCACWHWEARTDRLPW